VPDEKTPRTRRSAAEKAAATLEQAQKRYDRAIKKQERIVADADDAQAEVVEARRYLDFVKGDPNLPAEAEDEEA
jgi:lambda repressor-like predicted transcriptional regulator